MGLWGCACLAFPVTSLGLLVCLHVTAASLVQLTVVMRHGERAPSLRVSNWPFAPLEPGDLTTLGLQQMYALGEKLRERYINAKPYSHISDERSGQQLHVQSAYNDRCVESALAMLAGLLPPSAGQIWNQNFPWRPHAVFAEKPEHDPVTNALWSNVCPRIKQLQDEVMSTAEYAKWERSNDDLLKFVAKKLGYASGEFQAIGGVELSGYVVVSVENNKTEPWMLQPWRGNRTVYDASNDMQQYYLYVHYMYNDIKHILGGILLGGAMKSLTSFRLADPVNTNIFVTHRSKMIPMFSTLGLNLSDMKEQLSSEAALFELHRESDKLFVKLLLYSPANHNFIEVTIPGCGSPCSLSKLTRLTRSVIPKDWRQECTKLRADPQQASDAYPDWYWWVPAVCIIIILIISVYFIYKCVCRKSARTETIRILQS